MSPRALLLYGPPGSGKDTITAALTRLNPAYQLAERLKAGPGRTHGYRMTTIETIDALTARGDVLWRNDRYSSTYATDRPHLDQMLADHQIPVLHLGQADAIPAVTTAAPDISWTVVELWCPRDIMIERVTARGTGDVDERIAAYDQTPLLHGPTLRVSTAAFGPAAIARWIDVLTRGSDL
ncbi:ATP-binding protein [Rhodococcus qingshengii]|uniref:kinase n=1 Tax=Rhodococcus qingshengii TaxID=334542 RepID=UPI0021B12056|nr:kinase [Rhodococcus qingshengii]MCT6735439.1 kinase [Rhodococcus qingshengii]